MDHKIKLNNNSPIKNRKHRYFSPDIRRKRYSNMRSLKKYKPNIILRHQNQFLQLDTFLLFYKILG